MDFSQSGLPRHSLIEQAFDFSYDNIMANEKEAMRDFTQQIEMIHAQHVMNLDAAKQAGEMNDDEYRQQKEAMEKMRDQQMKMGPQLVSEELNRAFAARRVRPAQEVAGNADSPAPEVIAALLLIDTIRSPIDYRKVESAFGTGVAGMIANLVHIDAYPSERSVLLGQADENVKRAYLALMISGLEQIVGQAGQNPMQMLRFPPGQEQQIRDSLVLMWGNDAKLDSRFVEVFNKAAEVTASSYRLEIDGNEPQLVKGGFTPPKGPDFHPPAPKGPGNLGGDVF